MFETKTFLLPETLAGISAQIITEHLKLYTGYVKHTNLIQQKIADYQQEGDARIYELGELSRRFSFEYNGMKNHEYYFAQLEYGPVPLDPTTTLYERIVGQFGSFEQWTTMFTLLSKTRGIGWAVLAYDPTTDLLLHTWVDEQHLGHLNSCQFILGIDMWEHAYVADYQPSGKAQYIYDYLTQINWSVVANRFNLQ